MFTGVIHTLGTIQKMSVTKKGAEVTVTRPTRFALRLGDSIAIHGVCSTVKKYTKSTMTFEYMPETLERTTVPLWKKGHAVHLEQSVTLKDRLDGHMVMGHVDTTGIVQSLTPEGNSVVVTIKPKNKTELRFAAVKGSVALNGVSLTITHSNNTQLAVKLVPFTMGHTTFGTTKVGDMVNIEWDAIAKYVSHLYRKK